MYDQLKKQLTAKTWNFKSVTAMILFGAIILVFILFGFQGKHNAMGVGSAARVNNALISVAELRSETNRMTQIYGQLFGGQMGGDAQRQFLQQQAMENLIISELTSQAANSQGILATNAEVADMIMHDVPVFQENGRFDKELYLRLLEANHMSPPEFEEKMRKERKTVRARELFQAVSTPDPIEIAKNKALHENKMNVAFAKIDESQLAAGVSVSDADIKVRLADADFQKKVEADFSLNKASYGSEEQIHAAHLLLKVAPGDADAEKAALEKMTSIQKRAATEDFGKLAAEFSEDQGSKANHGDLGTFGRGKMVPEFEKAAFSQKVGEVGAPVRTNYGFHLIKVLEHKPAVVPELSAVQEKIAKKLIVQEKVETALRSVETALSKNDTAALDQALAGLKVKWDETGFVDLTTEGVAKMGSRLASQAIFEVSQQKPLLGHLVQDGNLKFVLKWKAAQKDNVATGSGAFEQMGKERAYEIYGKWTDQIRKSASIEKNPAVLRGE